MRLGALGVEAHVEEIQALAKSLPEIQREARIRMANTLRTLRSDPDGAREHHRAHEEALDRLGDASNSLMSITQEMLDLVDQSKRPERRGQDILR